MNMSTSDDPSELVAELRRFIAGATNVVKTDPLELTSIALHLLTALPAAREAVLEYFNTLFHDSVSRHLSSLEVDSATHSETPIEDIPVTNVYNTLCGLIAGNSEPWAPIISAWCLELLGDISSRYASRNRMEISLSDSLQLWMSCRTTVILIDINTQCLSCLMHSNSDSCINALLDTSVAHSPNFDWVVAHVGSCFPHTVITRVLSCGLKDFCENQCLEENRKLNSVVGILGHLASTHFNDIETALVRLFQWSLEDSSIITNEEKLIAAQKIAVVPFLLTLASMSPVLLKALSAKTILSLTVDDILRLNMISTKWWCYFTNGRQSMLDLVIHLFLCLEDNVFYILNFLFDIAAGCKCDILSITQTTQEIVEMLIAELDMLLRITTSIPPLIRTLQVQLPTMRCLLLSENKLKSEQVGRLFATLGKYNTQLLSSCVAYLLNYGTNDQHLENLIELLNHNPDPNLFGVGFSLAILNENENESDDEDDSEVENSSRIVWKNIDKLIKCEQNSGNGISLTVSRGLAENMQKIITYFRYHHRDVATSQIIASVLHHLLGANYRHLSVREILTLTEATVVYFFACLISARGNAEELKCCNLATKLITKLCLLSPIARSRATRLLVQSAIEGELSKLLGVTISEPAALPSSETHSLLMENITQGNNVMVTPSATSVFHAGVIGYGLKHEDNKSRISDEEIKINIQHIMSMIRCCCLLENGQIGTDYVINVSLIMVQLISTDVMFNGLPWPDEDFSKATVERDISIRRKVDSTPVIWTLLHFVALSRPALCYCSVILRALTATLMSQWNITCQRYQQAQYKELVETTVKLMEVFIAGQLLPAPLCAIYDAVPFLKAHQVLTILRDCIWLYMKDFVPAPSLFIRDGYNNQWRDITAPPPTRQYTETLRMAMLDNIDKIPHLYNVFFNTPSENH